MEASPVLFRDLTFIFLAAVVGGLLARSVKLPLILGFVFGGILISPFTPGLKISDLHAFEVFAEVGVVLLMFSIGVEFSIPDLLRVKWIALGGGTLGILLSMAFALATAWLAGWPITQGFVIGATISVASTMVLARLLADRNALGTKYGRVMIGITLVEDIAVVFMTIIIPIFSGPAEGRFTKAAWTLGKATLSTNPPRVPRDDRRPARPPPRRAHQRLRNFPAGGRRHLPGFRRHRAGRGFFRCPRRVSRRPLHQRRARICTRPTPRSSPCVTPLSRCSSSPSARWSCLRSFSTIFPCSA